MSEPTDDEMAERKARWEREALEVTPLPWNVVYGYQSGGPYEDGIQQSVDIIGANEDTVANNERYYPHAIKAADAELIVRSVNAHDALVEALEAMMAMHAPRGGQIVFDGPYDAAEAALAMAKGGK